MENGGIAPAWAGKALMSDISPGEAGPEKMGRVWRLRDQAPRRHVPKSAFALVELRLGRRERAFDFLGESFKGREARSIAHIKVAPFLDLLRGHLQFEELSTRILAKAATDLSAPKLSL